MRVCVHIHICIYIHMYIRACVCVQMLEWLDANGGSDAGVWRSALDYSTALVTAAIGRERVCEKESIYICVCVGVCVCVIMRYVWYVWRVSVYVWLLTAPHSSHQPSVECMCAYA
jgi:hypothetical protein